MCCSCMCIKNSRRSGSACEELLDPCAILCHYSARLSCDISIAKPMTMDLASEADLPQSERRFLFFLLPYSRTHRGIGIIKMLVIDERKTTKWPIPYRFLEKNCCH